MTDEERTLFEIALLLRKPVYELAANMPYTEFQGWVVFLNENPPERAEDLRTAQVLMALGVKDAMQRFPSLRSMKQTNKTVAKSLPQSFMFQMMQNAVGGDQIPL